MMNTSESLSLDENFKIHITVFLVLDSIVTCCTVVGNVMFMITLVLKHSLHTPPNVLLGALCLSDMLVGIIVQPLYLLEYSYKLADQSCDEIVNVKTILTWFCVGLSFQHILLISLDRYTALCHPFKYHSHATCKLHTRICILTSIVPLFVTTISIVLFVTHSHTIRNYTLFIVLLIALAAVAFSNWKVFSILRQRKRKIVVVGDISERINERETLNGRQERKKTYVIAIVVILFFICYFPLFTQFVLQLWYERVFTSLATFLALNLWADFFMLLNSSVNPLVYYVRMREIRRAAFTVLCRRHDSSIEQECTNAQTK